MNAESSKASTAAQVMLIAEEREQFIRECIELYSSENQKFESQQVITGRTTFPDETTHEPPHETKPDEHKSKALGATAEIETAPRILVTSASDILHGQMARVEEQTEPLLLADNAAEAKNGRVAGRLLFGLVATICLIAPINTSEIAVLPVSGQSADFPTRPIAARPSAAHTHALTETETAGASTPAPVHGGTVTDANVTTSWESTATLFEEFRQRYLPQAGGAVAHAPVKITGPPRNAPKPPVVRRVSGQRSAPRLQRQTYSSHPKRWRLPRRPTDGF